MSRLGAVNACLYPQALRSGPLLESKTPLPLVLILHFEQNPHSQQSMYKCYISINRIDFSLVEMLSVLAFTMLSLI